MILFFERKGKTMSKGLTAKDFAIKKIAEIIQLCDDLHYIKNEELRAKGLIQIEKLVNGIEEHLEYLDIKNEEED